MANTPTRSFRCSDELWRTSQGRARAKGLSMSGILVNALEDWSFLESLEDPGHDIPEQPEPEPTEVIKVIDLMAALEESLRVAKAKAGWVS